jgi:acyl-CoA thioester hydrolase
VSDLTTTAARPDPLRLTLECYPFVDEIATRYGDMDANAHINNLALESLHENARATMNQRLYPAAYRAGTRRFRLVTSQNAVHFLAEAHWPVTIQTGAGVGRIGRTSFIASTGLFVAGECIGVCDTVLVMLGDDGPEPIPAEFRAALQSALLGSPPSPRDSVTHHP